MVDRLSAERRSRLMSQIHSRNTKPELCVRSVLHGLGYRFRVHAKGMPGTPDLVFPSRRKIVFVHGCFWHGHNCRYGRAQPKSNIAFWTDKLARNRARDRRNSKLLRGLGWSVGVVWECRIKDGTWLAQAIGFLERA